MALGNQSPKPSEEAAGCPGSLFWDVSTVMVLTNSDGCNHPTRVSTVRFLSCFFPFVVLPSRRLLLSLFCPYPEAYSRCVMLRAVSGRCIHFAAHDGEPTNTFSCPTWIRDPDGIGSLASRWTYGVNWALDNSGIWRHMSCSDGCAGKNSQRPNSYSRG